jgi:hypothetical protein
MRADFKSISHICEVASVWELTKETIHLPLSCFQGGSASVGFAAFTQRVDASGRIPREQKMPKGHLPRVIHHQVYKCTKPNKRNQLPVSSC